MDAWKLVIFVVIIILYTGCWSYVIFHQPVHSQKNVHNEVSKLQPYFFGKALLIFQSGSRYQMVNLLGKKCWRTTSYLTLFGLSLGLLDFYMRTNDLNHYYALVWWISTIVLILTNWSLYLIYRNKWISKVKINFEQVSQELKFLENYHLINDPLIDQELHNNLKKFIFKKFLNHPKNKHALVWIYNWLRSYYAIARLAKNTNFERGIVFVHLNQRINFLKMMEMINDYFKHINLTLNGSPVASK